MGTSWRIGMGMVWIKMRSGACGGSKSAYGARLICVSCQFISSTICPSFSHRLAASLPLHLESSWMDHMLTTLTQVPHTPIGRIRIGATASGQGAGANADAPRRLQSSPPPRTPHANPISRIRRRSRSARLRPSASAATSNNVRATLLLLRRLIRWAVLRARVLASGPFSTVVEVRWGKREGDWGAMRTGRYRSPARVGRRCRCRCWRGSGGLVMSRARPGLKAWAWAWLWRAWASLSSGPSPSPEVGPGLARLGLRPWLESHVYNFQPRFKLARDMGY
jgi:hypothetical protein